MGAPTKHRGEAGELMEQVLVDGNLDRLSPEERALYYTRVCESLGLNPLTKPFDYIKLNGKLTLYAKRDCTDQLRSLRRVSVTRLEREHSGDVYVVTAYATTPDGRQDSSIGAVTIGNLKGDALANALMKAETKAKRRVTLSIVGLGWLDETEIETIPGARHHHEPEGHGHPALPAPVDESSDPEHELEPLETRPPEPLIDQDDARGLAAECATNHVSPALIREMLRRDYQVDRLSCLPAGSYTHVKSWIYQHRNTKPEAQPA